MKSDDCHYTVDGPAVIRCYPHKYVGQVNETSM